MCWRLYLLKSPLDSISPKSPELLLLAQSAQLLEDLRAADLVESLLPDMLSERIDWLLVLLVTAARTAAF